MTGDTLALYERDGTKISGPYASKALQPGAYVIGVGSSPAFGEQVGTYTLTSVFK
jgi:hypothetical protein